MRILLIGEYSRLHNSLKEGLIHLGHEVLLVGSGDGFKNYPVDYSIEAKWSKTKLINIPRRVIAKLFNYDFEKLEHGIRFYFFLNKFKNFDVVQLINESPIKTHKWFELYLLKKIAKQNHPFYLLSCGVDYLNVKFLMERTIKKSILQPLFDNPNLRKNYNYVFEYLNKSHKKLHDFVYENCNGIIASDMDYVLHLQKNPKFIKLIANPINHKKLQFEELKISDKVIIFLGINQWNKHQKGIQYFQKALDIIQEKHPNKVDIIVTENIPYQEYINLYNEAHILLDQTFAYDQGYNALEAMAKGKVVFTGAEKEFIQHYNLSERVAVNALPDVNYLVNELSFLIENPDEIIAIGKRARAFVEKEHDYIKIANQYLKTWNKAYVFN